MCSFGDTVNFPSFDDISTFETDFIQEFNESFFENVNDITSPPTSNCDSGDLNPPSIYPVGHSPKKDGPSMISHKYIHREERTKVLNISINKLNTIKDTEASLCRSVLINNTMKRLQEEASYEELLEQHWNYPRCYDNENNFDAKLVEEVLNLMDENLNNLNNSFNNSENTNAATDNDMVSSWKRSFDDMQDCDAQDVFSQFYLPPTPMLTCFDDDFNVAHNQPFPKRIRMGELPIEE